MPAMSKALLVSHKCNAKGHRAHVGQRWETDQILSTPQILSDTDIFLTCVNYFMKLYYLYAPWDLNETNKNHTALACEYVSNIIRAFKINNFLKQLDSQCTDILGNMTDKV